VNLLCIWDIAKTSFFVLDYIPQDKLCGNAVIVESMDPVSRDPHSHKADGDFFKLSIKTQKSGVHFSSLNSLKTVHFSTLNDTGKTKD
jgi:hypothetical protein